MMYFNYYGVLLGQYSTEKSVILADKYKSITFRVSKKSNKNSIKYAIKKLFKVEIHSIKTLNVKGKKVKFKGFFGKKKSWKKAIVILKKGYDINFSEFK